MLDGTCQRSPERFAWTFRRIFSGWYSWCSGKAGPSWLRLAGSSCGRTLRWTARLAKPKEQITSSTLYMARPTPGPYRGQPWKQSLTPWSRKLPRFGARWRDLLAWRSSWISLAQGPRNRLLYTTPVSEGPFLSYLVTKGVSPHNNGLFPARYNLWYCFKNDGLTENCSPENIADRSVGRTIHRLQVVFYPLIDSSD